MKSLSYFLLVLFPFFSFGQYVEYKIEGRILKPDSLKFAYLVSTGTTDVFLSVPLKNGGFKFLGKAELGGKLIRYGYIFLDKRADVTLQEVKSKMKQRVWTLGLTPTLRSVVLENLSLKIENNNLVSKSVITQGGQLTAELDERAGYMKERDYIGFIKKYPDSPNSLGLLQGVVRFMGLPMNGGIESAFGASAPEMYEALSDRLKKTNEAKELKKKIDSTGTN